MIHFTCFFIINSNSYDQLNKALIQKKHLDLHDFDERELSVISKLHDAGLIEETGLKAKPPQADHNKYPTSILLKITGACNVQCTYCYDYSKTRFKYRLSYNRIVQILDEVINNVDELSILFHGGEPLLRFDLIKEVVKYIQPFIRRGKKIKLGMQTNGTLFNDEIVSFIREHDVSIGLSLDSHIPVGNDHRYVRKGPTVLEKVKGVLDKYPNFLQERSGVLSVVTQRSLPFILDFSLWLQSEGIKNLSLSFLDTTGKASNMTEELVSPSEAVSLFDDFILAISKGDLVNLNFKSLTSRIDNVFTYNPQDFCYKGPCGAASDFLVLDSGGKTLTCDCIHDPYFEIDKSSHNLKDSIIGIKNRQKIFERSEWLSTESNCGTCPIFGFCGGTCVAKAIAKNGFSNSVDSIECALSKSIYPKVLNELSNINGVKPITDYYFNHKESNNLVYL